MSNPIIYSLSSEQVLHGAGGLLTDMLKASDSCLFLLSGGSAIGSYDPLVKLLQTGQKEAVAFGLVDERFGLPGHMHSNAQAINEACDLQNVCRERKLEFKTMLTGHNSLAESAAHYEQWLLSAFGTYTRRVAILGIGHDGHTAGIMPMEQEAFSQTFDNKLVAGYDSDSIHRQRITLTPQALQQCTDIVVIAMGEEKRHILQTVLHSQPEPAISDVPAVLLRHHSHVHVFTDVA